VLIRPANEADLAQVAAIYAREVRELLRPLCAGVGEPLLFEPDIP
jgi:hypothetical protein